MDIKVTLTQNKKEKPDYSNLPFGVYYTDHMFEWDYTEGIGWHDPRIVPFHNLEMSPCSMVLHYGQTTFEGLKAYLGKDGEIRLFRPELNMERLNISNERLVIPKFNPVRIYVEDEYCRAVRGGMGYTKTAGNYASSLIAQEIAEERGYTQVLWLDGVEKKYIEEVGTMNIMFVINNEVVTPALNGSILPGITRRSAIELLRANGYKVTERKVSIQEIFDAADNGTLNEAFGTGTAAVISPVGELLWEDRTIMINNGEIGPVSHLVYDTITGIQSGKIEDKYGWITKVD